MLAHVPGVRSLVLIGLALVLTSTSAAAEGWTLQHPVRFDSGDFGLEESPEGWKITTRSGLEAGVTGAPRLPLELVRLVLPQGMRIESVALEDASWLPLARGGAATRSAIPGPDGAPAVEELDAFGFGDSRVPARSVAVAGSGTWSGYSVGSIRLLPVRENDAGDLEYLAEGRLEISMAVDPRERLRREVEWPGQGARAREEIRRLVDNPEAVEASAPSPGRAPSLLEGPGPGDGLSRTVRPEPREVDYVIITSTALAPYWQPLADRREAEGIATVVVTLDEILASATPGADMQETIRNYLRDAWSRWGLDYVLLAGDSELIPPRYARSTYYPTTSYTDIPSDLYYAALDGTWNADGNGVPGEPTDDVDMLAELSIGRLSLDTPTEVNAWMTKLLNYEEPLDSAFLGRAIFLSEVLFPDDWTATSGQIISVDGAGYSEDLIFDQIIGGGNLMQSWRLYQNYTAYPGAVEETVQASLDSLDTGRFGLVNHIGHGFYYNASVGDGNIFADDAFALTNPNPFFVHALNCSSGAFDVDSLLERFLQNTNGGAVGSAGSSRAAFPYWSAFYQTRFFEEIFVFKNQRVGNAQRAARASFTPLAIYEGGHRWTHFSYSLFADPTMQMWVAEPRNAVVTHVGAVNLGTPTLTVSVSVSGGATGAVVAVKDVQGRIATATVDGGGNAVVDLAGLSDAVGLLDVTVVERNLARYEGTVDVVAGGVAHLHAEPVAVDDDGVAPSDGDGDGIIDSGETIEWGFRFSNEGGGPSVVDATAKLLAVDAPGATVLVDSVDVGTVADGAFVDAQAFVVALDPTVPDGSLLRFEVQSTDGVETWIDPVEMVVRAPVLVVSRLSVDDSASGNGDGIVDAGETFDLVVEVVNRGEADISGLGVVLGSTDPAVSIVDGTAVWGGLAPDDAAANSDPLTMVEADVATEHFSELVFTDAQGRQWTHEFELRAPAPPDDPAIDNLLGPDILALRMPGTTEPHFAGYRVYRRESGGLSFDAIDVEVSPLTGLLVDSGLPGLTRFEYQVTVVDSSCVESAPTAVVSASTAPPELVPGFPLPIGRELGGPLAVGDMLGDGTNIVTFGADWIYALDASGGELVDGDNDSQTLGPLGGDPNNLRFSPSGVSMADLDGDGMDEVIGSNWNSREVYVLKSDGSNFPGWPRLMNARSWATPSLGDLDGDGDLEIVINNTGARTYVFHHDGSDFLDGDFNPATVGPFHVRPGENFNRSTPAIRDLDGDGKDEIIFGTHYRDGVTDNMVHALRFDGTEAPGWPKNMGPSGYTVGHVTIGDLDDDGTVELILLTENNQLNIWEPDGSPFGAAPYNVYSAAAAKDSRAPAAALADFDNDGELEMVIVSIIDRDECDIMIMQHDGTLLPGWPRKLPGLSESSPLIADLDADGRLDVVFGIGGGTDGTPNILYAFSREGEDIGGFPISLAGPVKPVPVIADFDQNGNVDIVYAGYDRLVHVWAMPFPYHPALAPWATFQADNHRTGVYPAPLPVGTISAELDLSAVTGGVRLLATFAGALPRDLRFRVERRDDRATEWTELESGLQVSGGALIFVDGSAKPGERYAYRLVSSGGSLEFESEFIAVPALRVALHAAEPNPFNPRTTISFEIPGTAGSLVPTRVEVFDLKGRRVRQLHVGPLEPGPHALEWDGVDDGGQAVGSGVYLAVLRSAGEQRSIKMSLVK